MPSQTTTWWIDGKGRDSVQLERLTVGQVVEAMVYEVEERDSLRTRPARCLKECNTGMAIFDGRCMTINRFPGREGSSRREGSHFELQCQKWTKMREPQVAEVWPTRGWGGEREGAVESLLGASGKAAAKAWHGPVPCYLSS